LRLDDSHPRRDVSYESKGLRLGDPRCGSADGLRGRRGSADDSCRLAVAARLADANGVSADTDPDAYPDAYDATIVF
jgi:hypothetical protein